MEPKAQYILYKYLYLFICDYTKEKSLHLAINELDRRHSQSFSAIRRHLVYKYSDSGMNDAIAYDMYNQESGEFITPKNFSYITLDRDSQLNSLVKLAQKQRLAYNNCVTELLEYYKNLVQSVQIMQKFFIKHSYSNKTLDNNIKLLINTQSVVDQIIKEKSLLKSKNKKHNKKHDDQFVSALHAYFPILKEYIHFRYKLSVKDSYFYEFCDILDTAIADARHHDDTPDEVAIKEFWEMCELPTRTHFYNRIKYTTEASIEEKPTPFKKTKEEKDKSKTKPNKVKTVKVVEEIKEVKVEIKPQENKKQDICDSSFAFEAEESFVGYSVAVDIYTPHEIMIIPKTFDHIGFRKETKNNIDVSKIKKIVVGKHISRLLDNAFVMFKGLEELEFAEDCTFYRLPKHMIGDCKIKSIIVPDSVDTIDSDCFILCKSLKSISVSKNVDTSFLNLPESCKIIVRN